MFSSHLQHIMQNIGRLVDVCEASLHLCWFLQHTSGQFRPSSPTMGKTPWSGSTSQEVTHICHLLFQFSITSLSTQWLEISGWEIL